MSKEEKEKLINMIENKYGEMNSYIFASLNENGNCDILYFGQIVNLCFIEKSISTMLAARINATANFVPPHPISPLQVV